MQTTARILKNLLLGQQPPDGAFQPGDDNPRITVIKKYNGLFDVGDGFERLLKDCPDDDVINFTIIKEQKPLKKVNVPTFWGPGYFAMVRGSKTRRERNANLSKAGQK